jgi:hypothetical protein
MKIDFEIQEIGQPVLRMEPENLTDYDFLRELVKSKIPELDLNDSGEKSVVKLDMTNFFAQTHIVKIEKIDPPGPAGGQGAGSPGYAPGSQGSAQGGGPPPAHS